ncbi:Pituitary homeobox 2 [Cladophialophora chaetospira]|uniref:Pituitary homeobox 2 n=1 Tax=Cladophialophora chaetospira TaxID=386627 RepID=A0AA39CIB1_9EURO|nr:Pituitary homeobox 2 [Cladophialophora chaetospira]
MSPSINFDGMGSTSSGACTDFDSIDYTTITGQKWNDMPSEDFIQMISSEAVRGNKLVKSQHFLGQAKYERINDGLILASYQIRAAHQRYNDASQSEVVARSHSHGIIHHYYTQVEGQWKFGGLRTASGWYEHSLGQKVFPFMKD